MKKVLPIIAAVVIVAAGLVYYLVNKPKSQMPMDNMSNAAQSGQNASPQATNNVIIQGFAFTPANITVKKGTTVTWTNQDSAAHTVTETDNQDGPKNADLQKGQSYTFTYNSAGTFKYDCSIHPSMTGSVTVTD